MQYHATTLDPADYAHFELGLDLYPWQIEALTAIGKRYPTSIAAANESGKTTFLVAPAVLWFLTRYLRGKVVITSGSWLQVKSQLRPAIARFQDRLPWLDFQATEIKHQGEVDPVCVMFSTDNPGRAEGHHAEDPETAPLFYIIDEAKSVPDGIAEAVDRCGPQYRLFVSSPGSSAGFFYRSHHEEAPFFYRVKVTSADCPHILPSKIEHDRAKYGESDPLFRSMHLAEFMDEGGSLVLQAGDLQHCIDHPTRSLPGETVAFCDFAAGGDENVLAIRHGNTVDVLECWHQRDTIQGVREFIRLFQRYGLTQDMIYGDEGGLGIVMCDALKDAGWNITRVNNGVPAEDSDNYANRGSEMWFESARMIRQGEVNVPNDPVFFRQATTRRTRISATMKLALETKEDMSKRGLDSPDRADAIFGALTSGAHLSGAFSAQTLAQVQMGAPGFSRPIITRDRL